MKKILLSVLVVLYGITAPAQSRLTSSKSPEEKLNEQYCTGLFKSSDGKIFDLENETSPVAYFNILNWLEGRVPGLRVYILKNGTRVPYMRGQQSGIFVDEVQVNANFLNSLPTTDIAMIKVFRTAFLGGFNGGGGAIAIYTYNGEDE